MTSATTPAPAGTLPMNRPLYGAAELRRLLHPQSLAIVGASEREGNFGGLTIKNMSAYEGDVWAINPRGDSVFGRPGFRNLADLPGAPDCVAICTPRASVTGLMDECAAAGAGGVVVYASGYGETGSAEGLADQAALAAQAQDLGLPLIGPNCMGFVHHPSRLAVSFAPGYPEVPPLPGKVGVVSQSGALRDAFRELPNRGMGFTYLLSAGNSSDVDVWDFVSYLCDDPETEVIVLLFEGVSDGARMLAAGDKARRAGKRIVAYNAATGQSAKRTAASHTGALANNDAIVAAAMARAGFVIVHRIEDLCPTAAFLAKAPKTPKGPGAAVMSTSGGACVIAASKAEAAGVPLPEPTGTTWQRLRDAMPDFVTPANPCDITGMTLGNKTLFDDSATAFLDDAGIGALLIATPAMVPGSTENRVRGIAALAEAHPDTAIGLIWMVEWGTAPAALIAETDPRVALFQSMDQAMQALAAWLPGPGAAQEAASDSPALPRPDGPLSEAASRTLLAAEGLPVPREVVAMTLAAAQAAQAEIAGPVAVKLATPRIAHKTEAGGVRLNICDAAAMQTAWAELELAQSRALPGLAFEGVLVQEMIPDGIEVLIGGVNDPVFGPVVTVGAGGIMAELLQDSATALAPVNKAEARAMLDSLRMRPLLDGWRGAPPVDVDALVDLVVTVSEVLARGRDWIAELDINPVIATPDRLCAVDALIIPKD
ncbi:acetate--CoA ligase family protein [Pseudooceanicola sp.]|uniref:acetate--CoA ligase family protein n=1 Tax=Pseudooceanicola sp. TaxID=1914328 RepID=UPI002629851C|nr:acetate--CoA ligase family protein [Pseudooceanicola sp.]MDF1853873.1 acetate--CoA ligase family protein [Pseudooceanicola sp.]